MVEAFTGLATSISGSLLAQVSCPPLSPRTGNLARIPAIFPPIPIGEHRSDGIAQISLDDLALSGNAHRLFLVSLSRGHVVKPVMMNAVELRRATHPLARFLCEITTARAAACVPFVWGAASSLPFLPRIRLHDARTYGTAAQRLGAWADRVRHLGLLRNIVLDAYYPEVGRYGTGAAMQAAEAVFAADSAVSIAQLTVTASGTPHPYAVITASFIDLAAAFTGSLSSGLNWLTDYINHHPTPALAREVHGQAMHLTDPSGDWAAYRAACARRKDPTPIRYWPLCSPVPLRSGGWHATKGAGHRCRPAPCSCRRCRSRSVGLPLPDIGPRGHPQSLGKGAVEVALLHIERAAAGLGDWEVAHTWLAAAANGDISAGPNATLFVGAPALAFALHAAARPGWYERALESLDIRVADVTRRRLDQAHARIDRGDRPALAEFDLIKD
jgi:Lantibiotic dehydratase, N terminus/Lantibiotic biosynthesis dehydratase C-term